MSDIIRPKLLACTRTSHTPVRVDRKVVEMWTSDVAAGAFIDWVALAVSALSLRRQYGLSRIYQFGGVLARIRPAAVGADARIEVLNEDSLRVALADVCDFDEIRLNSKGDDTHRVVPPPREILQSVLSLERYSAKQFPPLEMIATCPVIGISGRLLVKRGYYRRERLRLEPTVKLAPVNTTPSKDEVKAAVSLLLDEYLGDFPLADAASKAHVLSAILTPLVMRLIVGPTPLHLAVASGPGIGKSLILSAISLIAGSSPAPPQPMRESEEENAKSLLALLVKGSTYIFYDNIMSLDSATISLAIASPACLYGGRLLGVTRWIDAPVRCCWLASGNNPKLSREMTRRVAPIRLSVDLERPWTRSGFKHPDLIRWGLAHRADLLHAALTLCTAWVAAGMPKGTETLGGFEGWCETIGGICEVAEVPGFLANQDEMTIKDEETLRWSAVTRLWWVRFQGFRVSIDQLFNLVCEVPELEVAFAATLGQGQDRTMKLRLGTAIKAIEGRVFGSHRVEVLADTTHKGYPMYRLVPVVQPLEPGAPDDAAVL